MQTRFIVKAVSACGTYRETLKFSTREEAEQYAAAIRATGAWVANVKEQN